MTLTEFLLARISEDEARAHYALSRGDGGALEYGGQWYGAIQHAKRWEPARVLAECAAKRAIVAEHQPYSDGYWRTEGTCVCCVDFHADMDCENKPWPCPTLRALAAVYAERDGFQEEWAPLLPGQD